MPLRVPSHTVCPALFNPDAMLTRVRLPLHAYCTLHAPFTFLTLLLRCTTLRALNLPRPDDRRPARLHKVEHGGYAVAQLESSVPGWSGEGCDVSEAALPPATHTRNTSYLTGPQSASCFFKTIPLGFAGRRAGGVVVEGWIRKGQAPEEGSGGEGAFP